VRFCERWDQAAFDPDYETFPLAFFEPMVREVFGREAYDPAHIQPGQVGPIS
jgi:predicted HD phosphohydrolase